ncbi:MAG: HigA family addiction module antitoxin [Bdellovibrionales bacterium]
MHMKNPVHPGELLKANLDELRLNVTNAAKILDVTRPTLSKIINGKSAISPEMAIRLSKAFGGSPDIWLKMQVAYDLAQAQKRAATINVKRYHGEHAGA